MATIGHDSEAAWVNEVKGYVHGEDVMVGWEWARGL